jgi:hypothetical protein
MIPIWNYMIKPCHFTRFCPYGNLVENYPLGDSEMSCTVFGHDCPAYYQVELFTEDIPSKKTLKEESDRFLAEIKRRGDKP